MKFLSLFAVLLLFACEALSTGAADPSYTGQPGCETEEELAVKYYPHFRIKRGYWSCETLGVPAVLELCPIAQGFLDPVKSCVPWAEWYWTPTVQPPSAALAV